MESLEKTLRLHESLFFNPRMAIHGSFEGRTTLNSLLERWANMLIQMLQLDPLKGDMKTLAKYLLNATKGGFNMVQWLRNFLSKCETLMTIVSWHVLILYPALLWRLHSWKVLRAAHPSPEFEKYGNKMTIDPLIGLDWQRTWVDGDKGPGMLGGTSWPLRGEREEYEYIVCMLD